MLSGGIDSATALYIARKMGYAPSALIFDYGQRHKKEIKFAKRLAKRVKCKYKVLKVPFSRKGSSLVDSRKRIPIRRTVGSIPSTYVPGRNIIFLSIAVSHAESLGARAVFIGAHTQDYSGYPDCRKEFFDIFRKLIRTGTKGGKRISILTPLVNMGKKEIIKKGLKLGVPYELTWSCYEGGGAPCGVCDSCYFRKEAFKELGIKDPYDKKS